MSDQYKNLDSGNEEQYDFNLPLSCCPSPGTLDWLAQFLPDIQAGLVDIPSNSLAAANYSITHGENVEIIHNSVMGNNNKNNGKAAPADQVMLSKKLFCFADGHILDPQRAALLFLDLSKRAYQLIIQRQNGFDSFSLTKVVGVPDLFQSLKEYLSSKVRLMFLIDEEYSLLTDELNLKGMWQPHLQMEVEFAVLLQNLMRSTMHYAISQASSSRKTNSQNVKSFVVCEFENELSLDRKADNRENISLSIQSFIPCGSSTKLSPCRVASAVYSLYLCGEVHEDFTILGCVFDIASTFCSSSSSVEFSYRKERHSSPGHSQDYHSHGTLSLSSLVPSEESPVGCFKIVYHPQRAQLTSKSHRNPGINKMWLHLLQQHEHSTNFGHESPEVIEDAKTNNHNRRKKSSSPWSAAGSISKEDLVRRYGMRLEEAAKSLRVSVSTFKRLCRAHGISRWPSAKKMREDDSVSQSSNALLSDLQHKGGNPSLNQNMSGNSETTRDNNMTQGRASANQEQLNRSQLYSDNLSFENPMTNALARMPQPPPENGIICEEVRENSISGQNRRRLEREADSMDEMSHFNKQPSEILNYAPERQAVDGARKESSSGTIEGSKNPTPESVSVYAMDDMNSTRMGVQPFLESTSVQPLNSTSCDENIGQKTKLLFDNLIALPLNDLIDPENETSMTKALSILEDNLYLFSEEQAEQILELSFDFPALVHSWRECYSRSQTYNQSLAETEKIRDLVETSVKDEESLKVRYEELESKEKDLKAQLEAVQKEKAGIAEQRNEKSNNTKHLVSLAEERVAGRTKEKHMMKKATNKLNSLGDQWAKIQSIFI